MADCSPGLPKTAVVLLGNIPISLSDATFDQFAQERSLTVENVQHKLKEKRRLITVSGTDEGRYMYSCSCTASTDDHNGFWLHIR